MSEPNRKITDLSLEELDEEIDRLSNFELNGGRYGCPEAREADERRLKTLILISIREQHLLRENSADLIDVKPNIASIGMNLNEAWRRFKTWFSLK